MPGGVTFFGALTCWRGRHVLRLSAAAKVYQHYVRNSNYFVPMYMGAVLPGLWLTRSSAFEAFFFFVSTSRRCNKSRAAPCSAISDRRRTSLSPRANKLLDSWNNGNTVNRVPGLTLRMRHWDKTPHTRGRFLKAIFSPMGMVLWCSVTAERCVFGKMSTRFFQICHFGCVLLYAYNRLLDCRVLAIFVGLERM